MVELKDKIDICKNFLVITEKNTAKTVKQK